MYLKELQRLRYKSFLDVEYHHPLFVNINSRVLKLYSAVVAWIFRASGATNFYLAIGGSNSGVGKTDLVNSRTFRATNNCYKGVAISEIALSIRLDINEIGFDLIDMDSALVHGGCNHSYSSMES